MAFTFRIVEIYRELAEQTAGGRGSDAALIKKCFEALDPLRGGVSAGTRRQVKRAIKGEIKPLLESISDREAKGFIGFAIEYVESRIIDLPRHVYVPWKETEVGELADWARKWRDFAAGKSKIFDVLFWGTGQKPLKQIDGGHRRGALLHSGLVPGAAWDPAL